MCTGVIEFTGLAYHDGAGPNQHDLVYVCALRHGYVVFAKRLRAHTKTDAPEHISFLWNSDLQKKIGGEETSISVHFADSLGALINP